MAAISLAADSFLAGDLDLGFTSGTGFFVSYPLAMATIGWHCRDDILLVGRKFLDISATGVDVQDSGCVLVASDWTSPMLQRLFCLHFSIIFAI
jgi:hypothetical protein